MASAGSVSVSGPETLATIADGDRRAGGESGGAPVVADDRFDNRPGQIATGAPEIRPGEWPRALGRFNPGDAP